MKSGETRRPTHRRGRRGSPRAYPLSLGAQHAVPIDSRNDLVSLFHPSFFNVPRGGRGWAFSAKLPDVRQPVFCKHHHQKKGIVDFVGVFSNNKTDNKYSDHPQPPKLF